MTITLFIVMFAMFILMYDRVSQIKRNDRVLYEFCNVRRVMMSYLRDNFDTISKDDYLKLRRSLDMLNNNIHYFDHYKAHIFRISFLIQMIKAAKDNLSQVDTLKSSNNEEIRKIISSYERSFLFAFLIFTPLFKTKLIISVILFILTLLIKALRHVSLEYASKIKKAIQTIETIEERRHSYAM